MRVLGLLLALGVGGAAGASEAIEGWAEARLGRPLSEVAAAMPDLKAEGADTLSGRRLIDGKAWNVRLSFRPNGGLRRISFLTRDGDEAAYAALRRSVETKYGPGQDLTFNDTERCRKIVERWKSGATDVKVFEFFAHHVGRGFEVRQGNRTARVELKADSRCPGSPDSLFATIPRAEAIVQLTVEEDR
jgi:hypothetical protein